MLSTPDICYHKATITYWKYGIGVNVTGNGQALAVGVTLPPTIKVRYIKYTHNAVWWVMGNGSEHVQFDF